MTKPRDVSARNAGRYSGQAARWPDIGQRTVQAVGWADSGQYTAQAAGWADIGQRTAQSIRVAGFPAVAGVTFVLGGG